MDLAFIWSHECPAGGEKTGRTTIFHCFLRTKKLPCFYQLSSLAFSRFLPLFEISAVNNAEGTMFNLRRLTILFRRKALDPILYFFFYFKWASKSKVELFLTFCNLLPRQISALTPHLLPEETTVVSKSTTGVKCLGFLVMLPRRAKFGSSYVPHDAQTRFTLKESLAIPCHKQYTQVC